MTDCKYIKNKLKEAKEHAKCKDKKQNQKRLKLFTKQIKDRGWADYETWSLDAYLSPYIVERLKVYKKKTNGYPGGLTEKSWNDILDKMILAFEIISDRAWDLTEEDYKIVKTGLELFAEYYLNLWW